MGGIARAWQRRDASFTLREIAIVPTLAGWRAEARALLRAEVPPDAIVWRDAGDEQASLIVAHVAHAAHDIGASFHVPKAFMRVAREVACHRDAARWDALYRVLWRITRGEAALIDVATDPDTYRVLTMARGVRRAVHKLHAFVRFKAVSGFTGTTSDDAGAPGESRTNYVAWFEPPHPVVEIASPFFARRFPSMCWSILTPDKCAHWDGTALTFTPGVPRSLAPTDDALEELWRTYYANIFNPARLALTAMQSEMPKRYWPDLPEASLIATLTREAPGRVARMLAQLDEPAESLPEELRATRDSSQPAGPPPQLVNATIVRNDLDLPGEWDAEHDPGVTVARDRARSVSVASPGRLLVDGVHVRVGTASWTDPTLLANGVFYPDGATTPEERLRYYASRFPLVEVDSTYYAMPARSMAAAWAARSPDDFVFDIKAFALMTGHAAETKCLPDWLRRALPRSVSTSTRVHARDLPTRLVDEVWERFLGALSPLRDAGKLGPVLLQYPRWFVPSRENADALRSARERLGDHAAAVEFRNPAWVSERVASRTFALLERLSLSYVAVDAPPGTSSSMPPLARVTTPGFAMVRLHGRRVDAWEAKHAVVSERYRYLYDHHELRDWAGRIVDLVSMTRDSASGMPDMAKARQGVHVVHNNCHANYGTTNASEITALLIEFDKERRLD